MKKYALLFMVIFSFTIFAGDVIVIKYKDGSSEKIVIKQQLSAIKSIKFVSSNSEKKEAVKTENKPNKVVVKKKVQPAKKVEKSKDKNDEFAKFENEMKAKLKPTFEGMWKTNFGNMIIKIKGNKVLGYYKNGKGKIEGTLSEDGYTITGRWAEVPDFKPPKHAGKFIFHLSETGASFHGKWGFGDEEPDSEWVGRKID
ncbi:hypothetical protein TTHT_1116 [Thermotomaculum hydrothermale]|uniref:Uncharacterized protein n=1 Tax=Thermotomaculum hydrothermale TaxID=981385 RepID=A0A7R6PU09_9BACT|nr:hypothetical protein [Thermotomaculum hydrothermale]BBB32652.1 hypothetical protein TTHT_1116 [Thermotomaculum hydrothermale]